MTPRERIKLKETQAEQALAERLARPTRYADKKPDKGVVRIAQYYNMPWRGFILQKGHFYGQDTNGDYFVSGLERGADNTIIVYGCAETGAKWYKYALPVSYGLCQRILAAVPERKAMGIDGVSFQPIAQACKHGKVRPQTTRRECLCYHKP